MNQILADFEAREIDPLARPLMLDMEGNIAESSGANFFLVRDGKIFTPPEEHVLGGISRRVSIDRAREIGIPVEEKRLTLYDAYTADEAFLTRTSFCLMPVSRINRWALLPAPGPVVQRLETRSGSGREPSARSARHSPPSFRPTRGTSLSTSSPAVAFASKIRSRWPTLATRTSFRVGCGSACQSRWLSPANRTSSFLMSRRLRSTSPFRRRSWISSSTLRDELKVSMLFITHDLGVIVRICDSVCVLYAGSIVEQAATRDLFEHPLHPYAKGLLASIPDLSVAGRRRLPYIPGRVPTW